MQKSAPAMVEANKCFIVPSIYDNNYIECLAKIIRENKIDALISLNDLELPILASSRESLEQLGVKLVVSSNEVIDICFDKWKTNDFLGKIGLNYPKTYLSLEDALSAIDMGQLNFPVVVKPRWGSASIGIEFPKDREELKLSYQLQNHKLSKTILAEASTSDINHAILIQEKIEGKEFGVDIVNDFECNNACVIVKEKLAMRAGETDKAVTRDNSTIQAIGRKIGAELKHIGNVDCDILERDGEYFVLEFNPRFGGGYPFSHEAGANIPKAYIAWLKGKIADQSCFEVEFDKAFSKCDRLIDIEA